MVSIVSGIFASIIRFDAISRKSKFSLFGFDFLSRISWLTSIYEELLGITVIFNNPSRFWFQPSSSFVNLDGIERLSIFVFWNVLVSIWLSWESGGIFTSVRFSQ